MIKLKYYTRIGTIKVIWISTLILLSSCLAPNFKNSEKIIFDGNNPDQCIDSDIKSVDCSSVIKNSTSATKTVSCSDETIQSECQLVSCKKGYFQKGNFCFLPQEVPSENVKLECLADASENTSCTHKIANATDAENTKTCNSHGTEYNYGPCQLKSCQNGFKVDNNSCIKTFCTPNAIKKVDCKDTITGAVAASRIDTCDIMGTAFSNGTCSLEACDGNLSINGNQCDSLFCTPGLKDITSCNSIIGGSKTATQTRACDYLGTSYSYGDCNLVECDDNYYRVGNTCVPLICTPYTFIKKNDCTAQISNSSIAKTTETCDATGTAVRNSSCKLFECDSSSIPTYTQNGNSCFAQICPPGDATTLNCKDQISNATTATKIRTCNNLGTGYENSICTLTACDAGFTKSNNICVPQNCTPGAVTNFSCIAEKTYALTADKEFTCNASGSAYQVTGNCILTSCRSTHAILNNECTPKVCLASTNTTLSCIDEIQFSTVAEKTESCNATGTGKTYDTCLATACDVDHKVAADQLSCVPKICNSGDNRTIECKDEIANAAKADQTEQCNADELGYSQVGTCTLVSCIAGYFAKGDNTCGIAIEFTTEDVFIDEGANGNTSPASFTIRRGAMLDQVLTVEIEIDLASTTAATDGNTLPTTTFVFAIGENEKTGFVNIVGNDSVEPNEIIVLNIKETLSPNTAAKNTLTIHITDDDDGACPDSLLDIKDIVSGVDYNYGDGVKEFTMAKGEVRTFAFKPITDESGTFTWDRATTVLAQNYLTKLVTISSCKGIVGGLVDNCRISNKNGTLKYSTKSPAAADECALLADEQYYLNIHTGIDIDITDVNYNNNDICLVDQACDIAFTANQICPSGTCQTSPQFKFEKPIDNVTEGGTPSNNGSNNAHQINITRNGGPNDAATLSIQATGGTATLTTDYSLPGATLGIVTMAFAAGETTRSFNVDVVKDIIDESNETIDLEFTGTGVNTGTSVLHIVDDDPENVKHICPVIEDPDLGLNTENYNIASGTTSYNINPDNYLQVALTNFIPLMGANALYQGTVSINYDTQNNTKLLFHITQCDNGAAIQAADNCSFSGLDTGSVNFTVDGAQDPLTNCILDGTKAHYVNIYVGEKDSYNQCPSVGACSLKFSAN